MTRNPPYETPSEVAAEDGIVIVDGPDGVAVALTADAAEETAARLRDAAQRARRQPPALSSRKHPRR